MKRVIAVAWLIAATFLFNSSSSAQAQSDRTRADDFLNLLEQARTASSNQKWPEAADAWEKVVRTNPVTAEYWRQLGTAHYNNKNYRQAIRAFEEAAKLFTGSPANMAYNIARSYAALNDKEQALAWLEKSFSYGFRSPHAAQREEVFALLQNEPRYRNLVALVDAGRMSRVEGWRYDLALLAREVKRKGYAPFRQVSERDFDAAVQRIHAAIPNLNDAQITIELMKLMRMVGDAHSMIYAFWERPEFLKHLPVDFAFFREGLYITAADTRYEGLLGARVLRFDDSTVEEAMRRLDPTISRDNSMAPLVMGAMRLRSLWLLNALGLTASAEKVSLTVVDRQGKTRAVALAADSNVPSRRLWDGLPDNWKAFHQTLAAPPPLYLRDVYRPYWFEYLPETKTLYFQFNRVLNDEKERFDKFCERLFRFVNDNDVQRLVIDMRWNNGGDSMLAPPLIRGLIRSDKINQRGKLFVIVGRRTFSAAQNVATWIERDTNAIFVGEQTGSSPNFIGEENAFELPYSKLMANVSDLFWQSSFPEDKRAWIAPLLYAPPVFEDYRNNRDAAMEAIITYHGVR